MISSLIKYPYCSYYENILLKEYIKMFLLSIIQVLVDSSNISSLPSNSFE